MINKTVTIVIEKGIIRLRSIIVYATHTLSRSNPFLAIDVLRERSKFLRKTVYLLEEQFKDLMPEKNTENDLEKELDYIKELEKPIENEHSICSIPEAVVTSGEKGDGLELPILLEISQENGIDVDAIIGDTAYSGKENIKIASEQNIKVVAKLNPTITKGFRKEEDKFDYNKDADRFVCPARHIAIRKAVQGKKILKKSSRYLLS